jgi:hypothetical protein
MNGSSRDAPFVALFAFNTSTASPIAEQANRVPLTNLASSDAVGLMSNRNWSTASVESAHLDTSVSIASNYKCRSRGERCGWGIC